MECSNYALSLHLEVFRRKIVLNQNPEQIARDTIDAMLIASGWVVQSKKQVNLQAGIGVAIREYQTDIGPADYILFVDKKYFALVNFNLNTYYINV